MTRSFWRQVVMALVAMPVAAGMLLWVGVPPGDYFFLEFAAALLVYVSLHELGHAIAAIANGFRILAYSVWPVTLRRTASSWNFQVRWKVAALGFVAADPVSSRNLRRRLMIFIAGGPIASALTTAICAAGARTNLPLPQWIHEMLGLTAVWAATMFVAGLIPWRSNFAVNDAARLQTLWKDDAEADCFCAIMLLTGALRAGLQIRDLNPELIAKVPGPDDGNADWVTGSLIKYNWLIETKREPEAREVLLDLLQHDLPTALKQQLQLTAAIVEARIAHDVDAARRWLAMTSGVRRRDAVYQNALLRAEAAIALLEGRLIDAEQKARKSLEYCAQIGDASAMLSIREKTEEMLAEIAAAQTSGPANSAAPADSGNNLASRA